MIDESLLVPGAVISLNGGILIMRADNELVWLVDIVQRVSMSMRKANSVDISIAAEHGTYLFNILDVYDVMEEQEQNND